MNIRNLLYGLLLLAPALVLAEGNNPSLHITAGDFSTRTLGHEQRDGRAYLVIQAEARNGRVAGAIGYCRLRAWVDLQDHLTRKVLLLDQNDQLLKTIRFSAFSQQQDKPRAGRMEVIDHQTGETTIFELDGLSNPLTLI
jgi:negative regulator of sigma E activity